MAQRAYRIISAGRTAATRKTIEGLFVNVPDDERHKIVCENAARFWRL